MVSDLDPFLTARADAAGPQIAASNDPDEDTTVKNMRTLGIAGGLVAAALVGGTLISAATGGTSAPGPSATGWPISRRRASTARPGRTAFATELGVSVDDLVPAAKAASIAAIDAAVAAGDLAEDIAAR